MWYITLEYWSATGKDKILPFITIWMDLENIILSEINQKKLKSIECHSYVKYKTETHQHRK